jgi:hypothetical protein
MSKAASAITGKFFELNGTCFRNEFSSFRVELSEVQIGRMISDSYGNLLESVGYVDPDAIDAYFCHNCQEYHFDAPIVEVEIGRVGSILARFNKIGWYNITCSHCNELIHGGTVIEGDNPNLAYIKQDFSGDFIKPTPESIEEMLRRAEEVAIRGELDPDNLEIIKKFAAKISYPLDGERVKRIESADDKVRIDRYVVELPETVRCMVEEIKDDYDCLFMDENQKEQIAEFLENLPRIQDRLPTNPEFRENLTFVLECYREEEFEYPISNADKEIKKWQDAKRQNEEELNKFKQLTEKLFPEK